MMSILIQVESTQYHSEVENLVQRAFLSASYSNGKEWLLVNQLRKSPDFNPDFSLIAFKDSVLAGHILLVRIKIHSLTGQVFHSLAIAPVSVIPEFQGQGIGSALMKAAHQAALKHQFQSIILLGDPDYYSRFGYQPASIWNIRAPFDVPDETFMAIELVKGSLTNVSGTVQYPPEFEEL